MLELGKPGSHGSPKGEAPVLRNGEVVAVFRASNWREAATAVVGEREWVYGKRRLELTGRLAVDPEGAPRLRATQRRLWSGTWTVDLEGTAVEARAISWWDPAHRFLVDGRQVAEGSSESGADIEVTLTADDSLPLDHQVFLLWVEFVVGRRGAAARAAAMGAGTSGGSS